LGGAGIFNVHGGGRGPGAHIIGVLIALAGLFALCIVAYGAVRAFGRFPSL